MDSTIDTNNSTLPRQTHSRKCFRCGNTKNYKAFHRNRTYKDGYVYECKECKRERMRIKYATESQSVTVTEKRCSKCEGLFPADRFKLHKSSPDGLMGLCRECVRLNQEKWRKNLRAELIAAYGAKCACCGERRIEFLSLDHINGGGYEHRKLCNFNSPTMWNQLKRAGYPKDRFRLLCHNCNQSLGIYGYCPHQNEERRAA